MSVFPLLVFIDGLFSKEQSDVTALPEGVFICPFNLVVYWLQGIFVYIPKHCTITSPIHLKFLSSGKKETTCYLRNSIVVEENSQVTFIEEYAGVTNFLAKQYFTYFATEIQLGKMRYCIITNYRMSIL